MAKKATDADENRDYEEALQNYEHAIQYFLHALKCKGPFSLFLPLSLSLSLFKYTDVCIFNIDEVHGEKAKESVRGKIKSYLERAENLKEHLKKERKKKSKQVEGGSSSKKSSGGKKK